MYFAFFSCPSDMPAAASVHSAEEESYLPFLNDFVPKKVQSASKHHMIKETSLVFNTVQTYLEQPASELSKVNSLGSLNSHHQPVKTFPATCFLW